MWKFSGASDTGSFTQARLAKSWHKRHSAFVWGAMCGCYHDKIGPSTPGSEQSRLLKSIANLLHHSSLVSLRVSSSLQYRLDFLVRTTLTPRNTTKLG